MPPVVVVHGFLSSRELMFPMTWRLQSAGHTVWTVPLSLLCIQDVRKLASQLAERVEQVLAETGADHVDLVGASQGGLIALWYCSQMDGWSKVRRLVSVGSPFRGTVAAWAGMPFIGAFSKGIRQLVPDSSLSRTLLETRAPTGKFISLAVMGDPVAAPERCLHPGAVNVVVPTRMLTALTHQWMILSPSVGDAIVDALAQDAPVLD